MPAQQEGVEFSAVSTEAEIEYVWPAVLPMIERGLRHGQGDGTTVDVMRHKVMAGDWLMWAVHEGDDVKAVVILSVNVHATGKKVFIQMLAGHDMDQWQEELQGLLLDFRDVIGAMCIEASCRKGLVKRLSKLGWREKAVVMELK